MIQTKNEFIVVTGASTGIGAATAREFAERGYHVLAGVRTTAEADGARGLSIEPVVLDITVGEHIEALASRIADDPQQRRLRAVVNNAGIEINAPLEVLPLETWREQFDVNLFGQVAVIKALLPALRLSRGRIVNIGSVGGEVALPNYSAYAATKFALEAVSDSLRREVAAQGIQVVIVQSGGVKTPLAERSGPLSLELAEHMSPEHKHLYQDMVTSAVDSQTAFLRHALTAEEAGARIARITTTKRPRARYPVGTDARFTLPMNRLLPTRLMDRILAR